MSPLELYKYDIENTKFKYDPRQEGVIRHAEALYHALIRSNQNDSGFLHSLLLRLGYFSKPVIKGLYIWGGVGRGKTYILNLLHKSLSTVPTCRLHFHQFMQSIHEKLKLNKSQENPLDLIASQIAQKIRVLFIDEFHVQDIADAMLLAGLLKPLFKHGIVLVATSNTATNDLYREGLQREKFLPAIAELNSHTLSIELSAGEDYRLLASNLLNGRMEKVIQSVLANAEVKDEHKHKKLAINNRLINTRVANEKIVWFDFNEICATPRSTSDYIKIADLYSQVVVTGIPVFSEASENEALRFVFMIDAFYDQQIRFYYTADDSPMKLYQGRLHQFAFQRTASRLIEFAANAFKLNLSTQEQAQVATIDLGSLKQYRHL